MGTKVVGRILAGFVVSLFLASSALANPTLTLTGPPPGNVMGNYYVAPYQGTVTNPTVAALGSGTLNLICDDFTHDVSKGMSWQVHISTFADLSATRFGTADSVQYQEAVWLINQMNFNSSTSTVLANNGYAQYAIWALFQAPNVGSNDSATKAWLSGIQSSAGLSAAQVLNINLMIDGAVTNYQGVNTAGFYILTPDAGQPGQEYITQVPVPEPSTVALCASGLLAFWSRRKRLV